MTPEIALSPDEVRARFHDLSVWTREGVRDPARPLLILYVLGRYALGSRRLIEFERIDEDVPRLFAEFGSPRSGDKPAASFWRLLEDEVWEVRGSEKARVNAGSAPTSAWLKKNETAGGFMPELFGAVAGDPDLLRDVAGDLLEAHFPGTLHPEIMAAVGLDPAMGIPPSRRDPKFRAAVLAAYQNRCALCAFDARMGDSAVGLEAAYIQWHKAGGPSTVDNGLALCSLHGKLFDRGAFTLTHDRQVLVSAAFQGPATTQKWVARYHGSRLRLPRRANHQPNPAHLDWHAREVFRAPARPLP